MPAKTPCEIAECVQEYATDKDEITEADFSRFDGRISRWLRTHVERATYLRHYPVQYHEEIECIFKRELDAVGFTKHGVKYETDGSRLSGSAFTTDGNSIINAFMIYAGLRLQGYTADEAYQLIGLIYGDDSLSCVESRFIKTVCSDIGMEIKVKVIQRHEDCSFLGRIFIDPWTSLTSFQDLQRTLGKLHTTIAPAMLVPLDMAAYAKVTGYLAADQLTPVLSKWCRLMQLLFEPADDQVITCEQRLALDKDLPFVARCNRSWPQDVDDVPKIYDVAAKRSNLDTAMFIKYETFLDHVLDQVGQVDRSIIIDLLSRYGPIDSASSEVLVDATLPVVVDDVPVMYIPEPKEEIYELEPWLLDMERVWFLAHPEVDNPYALWSYEDAKGQISYQEPLDPRPIVDPEDRKTPKFMFGDGMFPYGHGVRTWSPNVYLNWFSGGHFMKCPNVVQCA
jgi:hypothetical protein